MQVCGSKAWRKDRLPELKLTPDFLSKTNTAPGFSPISNQENCGGSWDQMTCWAWATPAKRPGSGCCVAPWVRLQPSHSARDFRALSAPPLHQCASFININRIWIYYATRLHLVTQHRFFHSSSGTLLEKWRSRLKFRVFIYSPCGGSIGHISLEAEVNLNNWETNLKTSLHLPPYSRVSISEYANVLPPIVPPTSLPLISELKDSLQQWALKKNSQEETQWAHEGETCSYSRDLGRILPSWPEKSPSWW